MGLQKTLRLSVGAKMILRQNLWTSKGLCNGTLGEIKDIVYKPGEQDGSIDSDDSWIQFVVYATTGCGTTSNN
ncbi:hypothetical protein C0J52_27765 [Blattella germanica]|nr:hypothetical protein C0J52_27765 [Blattella germanica]